MFNQKEEKSITSLSGGIAYTMDKNMELFSAVVTTVLQDKFYEKKSERMDRIIELVSQCDPQFVARLAVWARNEGNMRTAPVFLVALLTKYHNGDDLVRRTIWKVIRRADEMAELLSCYQFLFGKDTPFSRQMIKGIADVFCTFDEYQLAKYDRKGKFSLRDVLFLTYPKSKNDEQKILFDRIAQQMLKTPDTWEVILSRNDGIEKSVKWSALIKEEKLGHMALLRNLRNILDEVRDRETINEAARQLCNEDKVKKGKQFPFRYISAYEEIECHSNINTPVLLDALEKCMSVMSSSIELFEKNDSVAIFNDVSGSMDVKISQKSKIEGTTVGLLLGSILKSSLKYVVTVVFGDEAKIIHTPISGGIIQNCKTVSLYRNDVGHGTNGSAAFDVLLSQNIQCDKIVVITDMQMWGGDFEQKWNVYKQINKNSKLYIIDIAGYGESPINRLSGDVVYVSGWSDKIFKLLSMIDNQNVVKMIGQIEL